MPRRRWQRRGCTTSGYRLRSCSRPGSARANPSWLGLALGLYVASQVVSAYRWALLAWSVGFSQPFVSICTYYFSGMYLNLFGPGTVAGDVARVVLLAAGRRRAVALSTVIAHRAIGFLALVWIAAAAITLLPEQPFPGWLRWVAGLAIPATIAGWLWGPRLLARLLPPVNRWRVLVERDMAPYWHDRALLAASMAWAVAAQLLQIAGQFVVAHALGLQLPSAFFLVIVPLVMIAGTLPFSLQGVGVRETGYWYYLSRIGVQREAAMAVGLLASVVVLLTGLSGLPAFLIVRRDRPGALLSDVVGPGRGR
jgi:glycosyltransferase 2 family protein